MPKTRTMEQALKAGDRVFWYEPRPDAWYRAVYAAQGRPFVVENVLWWQDGIATEPCWADYHALPELLAACKAAAEYLDGMDLNPPFGSGPIREKCLAAIAKAKGGV